MGLAQAIGWALGLYESDEHYQKRLDKWNKQNNKYYEKIKTLVLYELKQNGYQGAVKLLEWENEAPSYNYNIPITIKQIWATKPEIREKEINWTFEEYYQKLEQKNNKTDLDKEKEILQLKIILAELEKNRK